MLVERETGCAFWDESSFFLLHFRQDGSGSTEYALESLYHLLQVYALLTPHESECLIRNCTVNTWGGAGNNVFLHLDLQHDNHYMYVTDLLRALGANVNEASVNRFCRAFFVIIKQFQRMDCELNICQNFGEHTKENLMHVDLKWLLLRN